MQLPRGTVPLESKCYINRSKGNWNGISAFKLLKKKKIPVGPPKPPSRLESLSEKESQRVSKRDREEEEEPKGRRKERREVKEKKKRGNEAEKEGE